MSVTDPTTSEQREAQRAAEAKAALPAVAETADAYVAARVAFFEAVKEAGAAGASLRKISAASSVSAEQIRRILKDLTKADRRI